MATGTLMRKIARQPAMPTSHPPSGGPTALAIAPADAQVPTARPRDSPVKTLPSMPRLFGMSIAAPTPCSDRASNRTVKLGAKAQRRDANPNNAVPSMRTRRRP